MIMALTISMDTDIGLTMSDAHAVIQSFMMNKAIAEDGSSVFTVKYSGLVWVDVSKYTSDKQAVVGFNYEFALDVGTDQNQYNLLKQCYLNLKTQEGFTDGVDA